jgi:hypothetical protein
VEQQQAPTATPADTLRQLIGDLAAAYRRRADRQPLPQADTPSNDQRPALMLAEAALRFPTPQTDGSKRPLQLAVLGPTQTGKSTVVNLLLDHPAAVVSPLAGFTVHPQGFTAGAESVDEAWTASLFPGWRRVEADTLSRDDTTAFALTRIPAGETRAAPPDPYVIWDTPDFDSLAARTYSRGVLETAALADAHLLVLSPEKYSDLSVWELLALLKPLGRPLAICLNKLAPDAEDTIIASLRKRLADLGPGCEQAPISALPYDADLLSANEPVTAARIDALRQTMRAELAAAAEVTHAERDAGVRALIRTHWDAWLAPVHAEHATADRWRERVSAAGEEFLRAYRRDYLDHPQRFDSFRRAAVELLQLLELPHVGSFIARARRVLTWPARQVYAAGRGWWEARGRTAGAVHSLGVEATVLVDTMRNLLTALQRDLGRQAQRDQPGAALWLALEQKLETEEPRLNERFEEAIKAHHALVLQQIQATANALYAELQKQPARLQAIRTARATIDALSLVLAIKTGGLSPLDVVWAPAAFSLSSLLMEGGAGLEMQRRERTLKAEQLKAVQAGLVENTFVRDLEQLLESLTDPALFAISRERVHEATQALQTWETPHE